MILVAVLDLAELLEAEQNEWSITFKQLPLNAFSQQMNLSVEKQMITI